MTVYRARIVSGGRLQIPADVRHALGLTEGDPVRLEIVDGELRVSSIRTVIERIRAEIASYVPSHISLADELIADRRAEAEHD